MSSSPVPNQLRLDRTLADLFAYVDKRVGLKHVLIVLIESIYEKCLMREFFLQNIPAKQQIVVPVEYKGFTFDEPLKLDVFVDGCLIVELKAVTEVLPIHKAQLLSYMKLMDVPLGLLINFHEMRLVDGVHRLVLRGADGKASGNNPTEDREGRKAT